MVELVVAVVEAFAACRFFGSNDGTGGVVEESIAGAGAVVAVVFACVSEEVLDVGAFGVGFARLVGVDGDGKNERGAGGGEFVAGGGDGGLEGGCWGELGGVGDGLDVVTGFEETDEIFFGHDIFSRLRTWLGRCGAPDV